MWKWYKKRESQRIQLMEATVKTIAARGLELASVDDICATASLNVSYVYRLFGSKNELLLKTFEKLDLELLEFVLENFRELNYRHLDFEEHARELFEKCWAYIVDHPENLRFYVRYYYSATFHSIGYDAHISRFEILLHKMKLAFNESADVTRAMHHIFDTMLRQAIDHVAHPVGTGKEACDACFSMVFSVAKMFR